MKKKQVKTNPLHLLNDKYVKSSSGPNSGGIVPVNSLFPVISWKQHKENEWSKRHTLREHFN